ncbi:MAG TPA: lytic transglycosylase domain-containing protein [Rhizomicrobium sp.]|nr:lytic transglycosylase domain-containing protein [Rhizomicrobium sp.]
MSFLRACLPSAILAAGLMSLAAAQPLPAVPPARTGQPAGEIMMPQPGAGLPGGIGNLSGPRPSRLRLLSPADHDLFVRAFEAGARGDWAGARILASQGQSATAKRLVEWRYTLDRDSGATFAEIDAVIKDTEAKNAAGTWPLRGTLQARAEAAITPDMPASAVLSWFGAKTPNSSLGKIRLGEALIAAGERQRGAASIRAGWSEGSFAPDIEEAILQKNGAHLTEESDRARLDALLWRGELSAAKRQMARVDTASAEIAQARIALQSYGLPKAQAALDRLGGTADPNLLFDWSRGLRLADRDGEAHAMLLHAPAAGLVKEHAARWWAEVNAQARDALSSGDPRLALELAQHAGFTAGDQYADQQFLIGFIALRFLKDPKTALQAFQKLEAGVTRPISKSRAHYWQGRTYEAMGDTANALARYRLAANYPETFYGQIALARTDPRPLLRLTDTAVEAAAATELDGEALMPEIKVLAELGQAGSLRQFVERNVEAYPAPRHVKRLMLLLQDWGYPEIAVRTAKSIGYGGTLMPAFTHPVIALPAYAGPGEAPDPALILGLIRQETEFDAYAVSSAGARGLMQMMPASAKIAAKQAGLPYRPDALLGDITYNVQLGMTEYRGHLARYDGSWVLAAAAYNAGPNNVKKWLANNGDPRTADPIDWIEQIPFGETRNYVQRILENTQVYRARLAGKDVPLRILADLYAPKAPAMPVLAVK